MQNQGNVHARSTTTRASGVAHTGQIAVKTLLALWAPIQRIYNELRSRRAIEDMLELDPALLRDMGLSRADVRRAVGLPLRMNAGADLARVSRRSSLE